MIHHLSTKDRRVRAIQEILELLNPQVGILDRYHGGKDHLFTEDDEYIDDKSKATYGIALFYVWALEQRESRRGWDEEHEQDVMVPWIMKMKMERRNDNEAHKGGRMKNEMARLKVSKPGEDEDNKAREINRDASGAEVTFHRYYHLYRNGELEADIAAAGGQVLSAGYEKDNWWAIAKASSGTQNYS